MIQFAKATRTASKLRMALVGPTKAGKSFTGLRLLFSLCKKIAVIQSEPGKIQLYEGESPDGIPWKFEVCELPDHSPEKYIEAILLAGKMGFDGILIDSLSHEWMGQGGMLEMVDKKSATGNDANKFTAWNGPTQIHTRLKEAIARSPAHMISTMRTKMEYVMVPMVNRAGKEVMAPQRIGLAPIQGKDFEYEFDLLGTINNDHVMTVEGRCSAVDGEVVVKPGPAFMAPVIEWLTKGVAAPADYYAVNDEDLKALAKAEEEAKSPEQKEKEAAEARKVATAKQREAFAAQKAASATEKQPGQSSVDALNSTKFELGKELPKGSESTTPPVTLLSAELKTAIATLYKQALAAGKFTKEELAAYLAAHKADATKDAALSNLSHARGLALQAELKSALMKSTDPAVGNAAAEPAFVAAKEATTATAATVTPIVIPAPKIIEKPGESPYDEATSLYTMAATITKSQHARISELVKAVPKSAFPTAELKRFIESHRAGTLSGLSNYQAGMLIVELEKRLPVAAA